MPEFSINGRTIGKNYPTYIITELSANHNQNYDSAIKFIDEAYLVGLDLFSSPFDTTSVDFL